MDRTIWVFGNSDERPGFGFPTAEDLRNYISERVFRVNGGRYLHTLTRDADVIVLSRHGLAYGRFDVVRRERPNDQDRVNYDIVKQVYVISCATLYEKPVRLYDLDVTVHQFGKSISEAQLALIESNAGQLQRFP
jgi:hypothetical protein